LQRIWISSTETFFRLKGWLWHANVVSEADAALALRVAAISVAQVRLTE
jgi:hypothetical protein